MRGLTELAWRAVAHEPVTVPLTAAQIEAPLAGTTAVGTWGGDGRRPVVARGGMTVCVPDGGQAGQDTWQLNRETDPYESWWRMTSWARYSVVVTNTGQARINGCALEPFAGFEGRRVE